MGIIYIERAGSFKWKIIFVSKYICWILWWYLICVWYHLIIIWHIKEHCCELLLLVVFIFGNKASTACLIGGLSIKKSNNNIWYHIRYGYQWIWSRQYCKDRFALTFSYIVIIHPISALFRTYLSQKQH